MTVNLHKIKDGRLVYGFVSLWPIDWSAHCTGIPRHVSFVGPFEAIFVLDIIKGIKSSLPNKIWHMQNIDNKRVARADFGTPVNIIRLMIEDTR